MSKYIPCVWVSIKLVNCWETRVFCFYLYKHCFPQGLSQFHPGSMVPWRNNPRIINPTIKYPENFAEHKILMCYIGNGVLADIPKNLGVYLQNLDVFLTDIPVGEACVIRGKLAEEVCLDANRLDCVESLISHAIEYEACWYVRVVVHLLSSYGGTSLATKMLRPAVETGRVDMALALIEYGADQYHHFGTGWNAHDMKWGDDCQVLVVAPKANNALAMVKMLLSTRMRLQPYYRSSDVMAAVDHRGFNCLCTTVEMGDMAVLDVLLTNHPTDLNARTRSRSGLTALHCMTNKSGDCCDDECVSTNCNIDVATYLIRRGANPYVLSKHGKSVEMCKKGFAKLAVVMEDRVCEWQTALAMGLHERLGSDSPLRFLDMELINLIATTTGIGSSVRKWPEDPKCHHIPMAPPKAWSSNKVNSVCKLCDK